MASVHCTNNTNKSLRAASESFQVSVYVFVWHSGKKSAYMTVFSDIIIHKVTSLCLAHLQSILTSLSYPSLKAFRCVSYHTVSHLLFFLSLLSFVLGLEKDTSAFITFMLMLWFQKWFNVYQTERMYLNGKYMLPGQTKVYHLDWTKQISKSFPVEK